MMNDDLFKKLTDDPPVLVLVPVYKLPWYQDKPATRDGGKHV